MFKVFICGTGNFEKEENDPWRISSQRRSKSCRHQSSHHHAKTKNSSKNPYSSRGLDKFATVLAELDEKRRKIYEQLGSPDSNLVRFGYSTSKEWVPIVVKLKEQREQQKIKKPARIVKKIEEPVSNEVVKEHKVVVKKTNKKSFIGIRPQLCLLLVLALILLCLVFSGKSLAILCTSIVWYLIPTLKEKQEKIRRSTKNKDYGRWSSEKKINPPPIEVKSFKRGYSNRNW
ncbi:hypothetical protein ACHQM5_015349 [Ranunculus cassubicifolius]